MKRIVIFASGSGSNAENIINYFSKQKTAVVSMILTNNPNAKVLERAKRLEIKSVVFNKEDFFKTENILQLLKQEADFIVLAGFLWKVPDKIVTSFCNKIINIHPSLLPKYGGKGMYGMHVHNAVVQNNEKESGITIHFVNENYDEGAIILQKQVEVTPTDTAENVAEKVHQLEYKYFPKTIEKCILNEQ